LPKQLLPKGTILSLPGDAWGKILGVVSRKTKGITSSYYKVKVYREEYQDYWVRVKYPELVDKRVVYIQVNRLREFADISSKGKILAFIEDSGELRLPDVQILVDIDRGTTKELPNGKV
jgi:hypothetical protein